MRLHGRDGPCLVLRRTGFTGDPACEFFRDRNDAEAIRDGLMKASEPEKAGK